MYMPDAIGVPAALLPSQVKVYAPAGFNPSAKVATGYPSVL